MSRKVSALAALLILLVASVSLSFAGVPKVIVCEEFGATW
jgi:hypothetical protein